MIAQIGVVLATYWQKAISSRLAMLAAIVPVLGVVEAVLVEKKQIAMAIWLGIYGPAMVALHFKQQIIQIHQRRIPNAIAAPVIVVVGLLALCGVALPAARIAIGIWSWGALGFVLALTAVTFALFAGQSGRILVLITPLFLMSAFSSVQHWLEDLCEGRNEAFGLPLLAAGICGIWATLASLLQKSEEDAGYFGRLDRRSYQRYGQRIDDPQAQPAFAKSLVARLMKLAERQVPLWPQWARGSRWQRIRLWRARHDVAFPLRLFVELSIYIFTYVFIWRVGVMLPAAQRRILVNGNVFLIIFCPVWTAAGAMWQERKTAAVESLRPVGRSQFLIDTGLAYATLMAAGWGLNIVAWCGLAYVLDVGDRSEMLRVLVLTAGLHVLIFGLGAWFMRYIQFTTFAALLGVGVAGIFLMVFISILWGVASFGAPIWFTPAIVIAGALITCDAYRRWMRTEMG